MSFRIKIADNPISLECDTHHEAVDMLLSLALFTDVDKLHLSLRGVAESVLDVDHVPFHFLGVKDDPQPTPKTPADMLTAVDDEAVLIANANSAAGYTVNALLKANGEPVLTKKLAKSVRTDPRAFGIALSRDIKALGLRDHRETYVETHKIHGGPNKSLTEYRKGQHFNKLVEALQEG